MSDVARNVARVRARIEAAALAAGRDPASVQLLGVTKTFDAERVLEAERGGLHCFAENRVQEAADKIPALRDACQNALEWHLIGSLQRNKGRRAVELFDVIQSVDRLALAQALDRVAGKQGRRLRVYLQINVDQEPQKGGVAAGEAARLLDGIAALPALEPVGLMAIPAARPDPEQLRPAFARLRGLRDELTLDHPGLRGLSMGMSADFEVAIQEGATCVRIGTALFGQRSST